MRRETKCPNADLQSDGKILPAHFGDKCNSLFKRMMSLLRANFVTELLLYSAQSHTVKAVSPNGGLVILSSPASVLVGLIVMLESKSNQTAVETSGLTGLQKGKKNQLLIRSMG